MCKSAAKKEIHYELLQEEQETKMKIKYLVHLNEIHKPIIRSSTFQIKFTKENAWKYKGNIQIFVFQFFGMKTTFWVDLKAGAE